MGVQGNRGRLTWRADRPRDFRSPVPTAAPVGLLTSRLSAVGHHHDAPLCRAFRPRPWGTVPPRSSPIRASTANTRRCPACRAIPRNWRGAAPDFETFRRSTPEARAAGTEAFGFCPLCQGARAEGRNTREGESGAIDTLRPGSPATMVSEALAATVVGIDQTQAAGPADMRHTGATAGALHIARDGKPRRPATDVLGPLAVVQTSRHLQRAGLVIIRACADGWRWHHGQRRVFRSGSSPVVANSAA